MVLLKSLKKQLNQFVSPELETLVEGATTLVQQPINPKPKNNLPAENAYSHGLEDIYNLENVDPSTIRKLGDEEETNYQSIEKVEVLSKKYPVTPTQQTELNLGPEFSSSMPSFVLSLPLEYLSIDGTTLNAANQSGITSIKDVLECDWDEVVLTRGLGQGHAEEIRSAFETAFRSQELILCQTIDYKALICCLLSKDLLLKHYVHLQEYGLESFVDLSPIMHLELKRTPQETKIKWIEESCSALKMTDCKEIARSSLEYVIKTYVTPWLWQKNGFAYDYEVMDRLEQVSEDPQIFDKTLKFLSSTYCDGESILRWILPEIEASIIFVDKVVKSKFSYCEEKVISYFYKPDLTYSLKELVLWVFRELAAEWRDVDGETIEKVIEHSSLFEVRKGMDHQLMVFLA
ncbi:MAG: hypothetical protein AAGG81_07295 [Chlamydiota bacterium]